MTEKEKPILRNPSSDNLKNPNKVGSKETIANKTTPNGKSTNVALRVLLLLILFMAGAVVGIYFMPSIKDRVPIIAQWAGYDSNSSDEIELINQSIVDQRSQINILTQRLNAQEEKMADMFSGSSAFDGTALAQRLDDLENMYSNNQNMPINGPSNQAARIETLNNRINQIESSIIPLSSNMINAQLTEKQHQAFEQEDKILSDKIKSVESRLAGFETIAAKDTSIALLNLKIAELRRKINSGKAYATEMNAINQIISQSSLKTNQQFMQALGELQEKATAGLPTVQSLRLQFDDLIPKLLRARGMDENTSWWQKTLSSIRNLITVRKTENIEQPDVGSDGLIVDIERWLRNFDVQSAVDTVRSLPAGLQNILNMWINDAESWIKGEQALQEIERIAAESYLTQNFENPEQRNGQ
ncbi:MAG: hypothetical protein O2963_01170 [Proteobacteria bacterium]|jgi:hypothetical protein|nr:hypothetical protein [Pseudomonadota bacterium]